MHLIARLTLGILEVIGGILGVALIAVDAWSEGTLAFAPLLFGGVYVLTIAAGVALLRGNRAGGLLSLLVQLLQLPRVATAGCTYSFAAGAGVWVMFGSSGAGISHSLGSAYSWSTIASAGAFPFGVNIVAALAIAVLLAIRSPRTKRAKDKRRPMAFA